MSAADQDSSLPYDGQFLPDGELLNRLKNSTNLPSPPSIALQIIELAKDPDVDIDKIAAVISMDPALSAKLLRITNSPLFAIRRNTENLRQAIVMLGLNGTLSLALSFSLVKSMPGESDEGLDYGNYWKRSLVSATCCRQLGVAASMGGGEDLFLAGLLQDIGMLVLDRAVPEVYKGIGSRQYDHQGLQQFEWEALGTDHAMVGGWLLEQWGLPERLQFAVAGSHDPGSVGNDCEYLGLVNCVSLSGMLADIAQADNPQRAFDAVAGLVQQRLDLDRDALYSIVESMDADLREAEELFDVNLENFNLVDSLLDQAKETLMIRNLETLQMADRLKETKDTLASEANDLKEKTRRDALTGLYNRAYLDEVLPREFRLARNHNWPLALLFADIDHFKRVNDTYGHLSGDLVLKEAGRMLKECIRDTDVAARYGGEEFLVVMPGTDVKGAQVVARRLIECFRSGSHKVSEHTAITVTVSLGISVQGGGIDYPALEALIAAADDALYEAKQQGRDRFVMSSSEPGTEPVV
jgi:diguanylate cyclase (GGDEF)-like protein